jgi:succinate-semialdehyde dehydrogenase/glutarate-semialdehyde dehydrogenase
MASNLIGGHWQPPTGNRAIDRDDPVDGRPSHTITVSSPADVEAAVAAAVAAARAWADTPAGERGAALRRWADRLRAACAEMAEAQARVLGIEPAEAAGAAEAAADGVAQFAELGPVHRGRSLAGGPGALDAMVHSPRGVTAVIVPWNDPVPLVTQAVAANLAVGNTVVVKPSERATPPALRALELLHDCDLPDGVLNVLVGDGEVGRWLVEHPGVGTVLHTGSLRTGREIASLCARRGAKAILELGGKDALVVDADVDPGWAAEQAALGAFANSGQICTAVERVYTVGDVHGPFVEALADLATKRGALPLVDTVQRDVVHGHVADALARGAQALCGGEVPDRPGAWYPATVLVGVDDDMVVMRDETFGPVAPVARVDGFDEALARAAASSYGLAATVLTGRHDHAVRAAERLPVGTVKINAVFGGAPGGSAEPHGASGMGVGYGPELLDELCRWRVVHWSAPVLRADEHR